METIYLERWLHDRIRRTPREDPEFRYVFGTDCRDAVTRADIDRYHLFRLRKQIAYVYQKSAFYRRLFDTHGIKADDISSLADLSALPFTTPADIARRPYDFACVPLGQIERATTFRSSGTTGPRKRMFFSRRDLETITDFMAVGMRSVAGAGDIVQIMLPAMRPNDQADLLAAGVRKMGGTPVVTGTLPSSEEQVRTVDREHPSVLFAGTPVMYRITQETRHNHDLKRKGVKTVFVTSEYLADCMKKQLQDAWDCDVHVHYGLTEMGLGVAVQCHTHEGYHFNEADLMAEIVDPQTGKVLGDDTEGELVFTALSLEAMPLIRYRTHDITRLIGSPCQCGATTLKRLGKVNRRLEAVIKIGGGDELYPAIFDELLFAIPDIIEYKVVLGKDGAKDVLSLQIEVVQGSRTTPEAIARALLSHPVIARNVSASRMSAPRVELVPQGTLVRMTRAKKLIVDERQSTG